MTLPPAYAHTLRGHMINLRDPKPTHVSVLDACHNTARINRYNGGTNKPYSVAHHSLLVGNWLYDKGARLEIVLGGYLHDLAEAYLGDITYPVQELLWGGDDEASKVVKSRYQDAVKRLDALFAAEVGIDPSWLHHGAVRSADLRILLDERAHFLPLLQEGEPPWNLDALELKPLGVNFSVAAHASPIDVVLYCAIEIAKRSLHNEP